MPYLSGIDIRLVVSRSGSISFVVVPVKIVLAVFFPLFERTGLTDDIADGAGRRGDTHPARATVLLARIEPTDRPRIGRRGAPPTMFHPLTEVRREHLVRITVRLGDASGRHGIW